MTWNPPKRSPDDPQTRRPLLLAAIAAAAPLSSARASDVNVYSARREVLIRPLLHRFTAQTGIKMNLVADSADALIDRLRSEGVHSPADALLTVDAGILAGRKERK